MSPIDGVGWCTRSVLRCSCTRTPPAIGCSLPSNSCANCPPPSSCWESGELTFRHARAVCDAVIGLSAEQCEAIEADVLPDLVGLSIAEFSKSLAKAVHRYAPNLVEDRRRAEIDERRVWMKGTRNGTVTLGAKGLDPISAAAVMHGLNTVADEMALADREACKAAASAASTEDHDTPSENLTSRDTPSGMPSCRTANQRRVDALISLATRGATTSASRPPIGVNVCVALSTLIGADDQPGEIDGPGFAPGSPITAAQARLLAHDSDSTWRRLVTDSLGGSSTTDVRSTDHRQRSPTSSRLATGPVAACTATAMRLHATSTITRTGGTSVRPPHTISVRSAAAITSRST